jgi:phosphatidylethanolamine-binding protein (PEBP) family uncharacterized protein
VISPHVYLDDPDALGTCTWCHLIESNGAHDEEAIAAYREHRAALADAMAAAQDAARARYDPEVDG